MIVQQYRFLSDSWDQELDTSLDSQNTLVVIFASSDLSFLLPPFKRLRQVFPHSKFIGCSTAGEIYEDTLSDERFVVQVMKFEKSRLSLVSEEINASKDSYEVGRSLAHKLGSPKGVMVFTDGLNVNGTQFTKGLSAVFKDKVPVVGGLAGDDVKFETTWVIANDTIASNLTVAIGLYGDNLYFGYGSSGGWQSLGVKRKVTLAKENVVYELDNQPALALYKHYLGSLANDLPASGLLFPLGIYGEDEIKVRTILSVDEEEQSIIFAGDIPDGSRVTLMKSSFYNLVQGAIDASNRIAFEKKECSVYSNIVISCVGRKLVLKQRVDDEIEAILSSYEKKNVRQIGFYSYGEISPVPSGECDLYNQTMTVISLGEY
ncbi:MAG TPA: hypothetical protein ENK82_01615 [Campylobacterales bacterium]|nr:hypothetical protein [Campylobacterales bacterium]